jgi:type II secretory pathway component PulF
MYFFLALLVIALQSRNAEGWRALLEKALNAIPVLGSARRSLALSRLAAALESLLSAGVSVIEAWGLSAAASGSLTLRRTVNAWGGDLGAGKSPAELVTQCGRFPDLFASQYATGELSGKLDDVLVRLREYYRGEGTRKLRALAQWTPRFVYLCIALYIGYRVVQFWSGYFKEVGNAGSF